MSAYERFIAGLKQHPHTVGYWLTVSAYMLTACWFAETYFGHSFFEIWKFALPTGIIVSASYLLVGARTGVLFAGLGIAAMLGYPAYIAGWFG